jgi:uncharacterized LabA/DUF88 family protein
MNHGNSGIVWLIDGAYILKGHTGRIDYNELRNQLQAWAGGPFDQIIFYNSFVDGDARADRFNNDLKLNGFAVKLFPLKRATGGTCDSCGRQCERMVQRGVDVAICTDLLRLAYEGKFRRVVLSAGDGDLLEAVRLVKSRFQEVYLSGYKDSMSHDLAREANKTFWL